MRFIEFAGKKRPVAWNMAAYMEAARELDLSLDALRAGGMDEFQILKLMYIGLKYGCEDAGTRLDLSFGQFADLTYEDEAGFAELSKAFQAEFTDVSRKMVERAKKKGIDIEKLTAEVEEALGTQDPPQAP